MPKITAPDAAHMAGEQVSYIGPLQLRFVDGVADVEGDLPDTVAGYLRQHGYGIDGKAEAPTDPHVEPAVDSRDLAGQQLIGTPLRDAAVDPQPGDFLPPVNAGDADPHGPSVVAPGIHAEGERVVRSGPVRTDPDEQSADEQAFAEKLLIDQEPVTAPVAAGDFLEQGGPLGMSDPGSVQAGVDAAKAGEVYADAAVPAGQEPRGNASLSAWQDYAKSQGATDEQLDGKSRDDLRAAYGS